MYLRGFVTGHFNTEYDKWNQLTSVTTNGTTTSYKYDPDGLLYERVNGGTKTRYYYFDSNLIAEGTVNADGSVTKKASYIRGVGLIARADASGSKAYYLTNGHGDVVEMRNSIGGVVNKYSYSLWGSVTNVQETVANPFKYSGEFWDDSTGLQYLRARWYDPSIGRFINKDTYEGQIANPLSLNLYTYVHNNPLKYTDPTGNMGRPTCANWDNECRAKGEFDRQLQLAHRAPTIAAVEIMADNLLNSNPVGTGVAASIKTIGYAISYVSGILKAVFAETKALKVLNLGAGDNIISGVINTDIKTGKGIDLVIDASKALPYADESIDAMIALNSYGYAAVNSFTTAALKPGGTFTLVGTISNPWFKVFYKASAEDLKLLGYEVVSIGKADEAYKYGTKTTDGTDINPDKLMQIVLRKIGGK